MLIVYADYRINSTCLCSEIEERFAVHYFIRDFSNIRWWKKAISWYSLISDTLFSIYSIFSCHCGSAWISWFCCKSQNVLIPCILSIENLIPRLKIGQTKIKTSSQKSTVEYIFLFCTLYLLYVMADSFLLFIIL